MELFRGKKHPVEELLLDRVDVDDDDVLVFSEDDLDDLEAKGSYFAIGSFSGQFPGKDAIEAVCSRWKVPCTYMIHPSGWIVYKFATDQDREQVVKVGKFLQGRAQLHVRIMPDWFHFDINEMCFVPVWVVLKNLPIKCYNRKSLSLIAAKIGRPVQMDDFTKEKTRLRYARILVDVDASKPMKRSLTMVHPNGSTIQQKIEYSYEPTYCAKCCSLTHSTERCKVEVKVAVQEDERRGRSPTVKPAACSTPEAIKADKTVNVDDLPDVASETEGKGKEVIVEDSDDDTEYVQHTEKVTDEDIVEFDALKTPPPAPQPQVPPKTFTKKEILNMPGSKILQRPRSHSVKRGQNRSRSVARRSRNPPSHK